MADRRKKNLGYGDELEEFKIYGHVVDMVKTGRRLYRRDNDIIPPKEVVFIINHLTKRISTLEGLVGGIGRRRPRFGWKRGN